ncbi:MAG: hypothetical protein KGH72_03140 [Candidatus Micrarchaeota archaeon]|nr:hypothetical protein [Candidatus Micrarchaeota archaeon]
MPIDAGDIAKRTILSMYEDKQLFMIVLIQAIIISVASYLLVPGIFGTLSSALANFESGSASPGSFIQTIIGWVIYIIGIWIVIFLIEMFFVVATLAKAYYGRSRGIADALRIAAGRYLYALADYILIFLAFGVGYAAIFLLGIFVHVLFILFIPYVILAVYASIMISLTIPFAVVGRKGPIDSLRMSWAAVKGNWLHVFLAFLVVGIVYYIIVGIIEAPVVLQIFAFDFSAAHNMTAVHNVSALNSSSRAALQMNLTGSIINNELHEVQSPFSIVVSLVSNILSAWFTIAAALIYKDMVVPKAKSSSRAGKKQG